MLKNKTIKVTAHAKVNLTLHVVGQRANGYHDLQSLVCLTEFGDQIHLSPASEFGFHVTGPYALGIPVDDSNLVVQAAEFMAHKYSRSLNCKIVLEKNLPMASGIGGGSSDAAAAMRALSQFWSVSLPNVDELMTLGADIPVCMSTGLTLMEGAGEQITHLSPAPNWGLLLVNPNVELQISHVCCWIVKNSMYNGYLFLAELICIRLLYCCLICLLICCLVQIRLGVRDLCSITCFLVVVEKMFVWSAYLKKRLSVSDSYGVGDNCRGILSVCECAKWR